MQPEWRKDSSTLRFGKVEVGRVPRVCASVAARNPSTLVERAAEAGGDLVELRVDSLDDPGARGLERELKSVDIDGPKVLTVRMESEEGDFRGSEGERRELLVELMEHFEAVDVELEAPGATLSAVQEKARELRIPVIVSFHDFSETSSREELVSVFERASEEGDLAKVAVTPRSHRDVLTLLEATLEAKSGLGEPLCSIAMGDLGRHSRLVAPVYGSDLTYAAAGEAVAPGQLSVEETLEGLELMGVR